MPVASWSSRSWTARACRASSCRWPMRSELPHLTLSPAPSTPHPTPLRGWWCGNGIRILHTPSEPQVWKVWNPVFLHALRRRIATILHSLAVTVRLGCAKIAASAHDDFTDLNDRRLVGVLWDICHNLRSVSAKTGLEFLNRLAENVAHPDVRSGSAGRSARKALVHGVVLARFTQSIFHEGHVLVPVIVVVEAGARHICIHNTYLNHDLLLIGAARFSSGDKDEPCVRFARPATWNDRKLESFPAGKAGGEIAGLRLNRRCQQHKRPGCRVAVREGGAT